MSLHAPSCGNRSSADVMTDPHSEGFAGAPGVVRGDSIAYGDGGMMLPADVEMEEGPWEKGAHRCSLEPWEGVRPPTQRSGLQTSGLRAEGGNVCVVSATGCCSMVQWSAAAGGLSTPAAPHAGSALAASHSGCFSPVATHPGGPSLPPWVVSCCSGFSQIPPIPALRPADSPVHRLPGVSCLVAEVRVIQ